MDGKKVRWKKDRLIDGWRYMYIIVDRQVVGWKANSWMER